MEIAHYGFQWFFVNQVLEWLLVLTACYCGTRLVRAYEHRARRRLRADRPALQRRVRELERETEEQRVRLQQLLEAERFTSALLLKPVSRGRLRDDEQVDRPGVGRIG